MEPSAHRPISSIILRLEGTNGWTPMLSLFMIDMQPCLPACGQLPTQQNSRISPIMPVFGVSISSTAKSYNLFPRAFRHLALVLLNWLAHQRGNVDRPASCGVRVRTSVSVWNATHGACPRAVVLACSILLISFIHCHYIVKILWTFKASTRNIDAGVTVGRIYH
ncbi:uncharacterized protein EI90DRAFT_1983693 [Cantharellus anzutake]|uniref:uncharacterized protein n=1 Tax=Cantharellus anzutake TaxID=1750568 RepID=UPI001905B2CB|nr:uncharacterized protein EI90DRAFT_1983693 [Cantharellus anzutake]KAF8326018.1 hypothetical protein EI90DRAFT_1983693 [Cantharellus anzutake]